MIRVFEDQSSLKINVFLKDGRSFLGKDIPSSPFGEKEKIISFWEKNSVVGFPMESVDRFELYEDLD